MCLRSGTAAHGEACAILQDETTPGDQLCVPAAGCFEQPDGSGLCRIYCKEVGITPSDPCPGGADCTDGASLGLTGADENVGVCPD